MGLQRPFKLLNNDDFKFRLSSQAGMRSLSDKHRIQGEGQGTVTLEKEDESSYS